MTVRVPADSQLGRQHFDLPLSHSRLVKEEFPFHGWKRTRKADAYML